MNEPAAIYLSNAAELMFTRFLLANMWQSVQREFACRFAGLRRVWTVRSAGGVVLAFYFSRAPAARPDRGIAMPLRSVRVRRCTGEGNYT